MRRSGKRRVAAVAALALGLVWLGADRADGLRPRIFRPGGNVLFLRATVFEFQEEAGGVPELPERQDQRTQQLILERDGDRAFFMAEVDHVVTFGLETELGLPDGTSLEITILREQPQRTLRTLVVENTAEGSTEQILNLRVERARRPTQARLGVPLSLPNRFLVLDVRLP